MTINEAYQQVLADLQQLDAQITLRLPASLFSVRRQLHYLKQIQNQLEALQEYVYLVFGKGGSPSAYWKYCLLLEQIHQMYRNTCNLRLLAEEYPIDPEGTTACLRSLYQ
jgi:hypothetical protein